MALRRFIRRRPSPADPHQDLADAGSKDQELEERRLAAAVVRGEVPPVWYRQRMAVLGAEQEPAAGPDTDAPVEDRMRPD
jgi:hypothetical protein